MGSGGENGGGGAVGGTGADSGGAGATSSGGAGGLARAGAAGMVGAGGSAAGAGGAGNAGQGTAGAAGAGPTGPFVCNQMTGGKLTSELFNGGFENGLDKARWQLKWKDDAWVEQWANSQSAFWSAPIESACGNDSTSPDRVVFMVFSWSLKSQADWRTKITQAVENFKSKYPKLRRLDFINQIVGPGNMLCPTPPAANETIVVSAELKAAMQEVAAAYPGFVFLNPVWEARTCADFQGGGPHLTSAGNTAAALPVATHFASSQ